MTDVFGDFGSMADVMSEYTLFSPFGWMPVWVIPCKLGDTD